MNFYLRFGLFICVLVKLGNTDSSFQILDDELYTRIVSESTVLSLAEIILNHNNLTNSVSDDCAEDLDDMVSLQGLWVWRMLDASGKLPHGILKFNLNHFGQYQQCIDTSFTKESGRRERGQHCMMNVRVQVNIPQSSQTFMERSNFGGFHLDAGLHNAYFEDRLNRIGPSDNAVSLNFNIAACLPSSCSPAEINAILRNRSSTLTEIDIFEPSCTMDAPVELSAGDLVTITFFSFIGLIMICSTAYDLWYQKIKKGDEKQIKPLYIAFSVYTNSHRLFTPSKNPGPLACLHGLRAISILWVVLGHRYSTAVSSPYENRTDAMEWALKMRASIILAANVAVDTFFVMSGVLLSYSFFKSAKLSNISRELPIFYIHRILRLTPLFAVIILLYVTFLPHYGNGPNKYFINDYIVEPCRREWWTALLYVQNYVYDRFYCVGQSWYLCVDMQMYVISPLLLYPLLWNKKIGVIWVSFCIAIAQATAFAVAYVNAWPVGIFSNSGTYNDEFYIVPHTRATPYFIGILAGYILLNSFKKLKITTIQYNFMQLNDMKKILIILGWLCSLTILNTVVYGMYPLNKADHVVSHWEDTLYIAFSRTGWALGILWIIVACAYGYGGPINWFLSLPIWEIIGRFSYAVYLTHMMLQLMLTYFQNHVRLFTHMTMLSEFAFDLVLSFGLSYILILAFESPVSVLEKLLFKKEKPKSNIEEVLPQVRQEVIEVHDKTY